MVDLLALADSLMKVREVKDLLLQERLEIMIEFLKKVGEVQIKTAIDELHDLPRSTQPEKECDRAIGHLKVAANALVMSLKKRPLLRRAAGFDKKRTMRTYRQIAGCYLIITVLYRCQQNTQLAAEYADRTLTAFEGCASIRTLMLSREYGLRFTCNGGTDQAPTIAVIDCPELRTLMARYKLPGLPDETTFGRIANAQVNEERMRLLGWLNQRKQLP